MKITCDLVFNRSRNPVHDPKGLTRNGSRQSQDSNLGNALSLWIHVTCFKCFKCLSRGWVPAPNYRFRNFDAMAGRQGELDMPLLASPAPHVGTSEAMVSPQSSAWKRLLVNSPPAWAASPETPSTATIAAQRIPPFPWPSPNIQIFGPCGPCLLGQDTQIPQHSNFSEDEEEIARFLSHCSFDSETKLGLGVPLRTPSPRKRGSLDTTSYTWTPGQMGSGAHSTVGSGTTLDSAQRFRRDEIGETPATESKVSPASFASPTAPQDVGDIPRVVPREKGAHGEPEAQGATGTKQTDGIPGMGHNPKLDVLAWLTTIDCQIRWSLCRCRCRCRWGQRLRVRCAPGLCATSAQHNI